MDDRTPDAPDEALAGLVLAPSLGVRINGAPVATPKAIPWGYQAGVGATITIEVAHKGDTYLFIVAEDHSVKTQVVRGNGPGSSGTHAIGALRLAAEHLEAAAGTLSEMRKTILFSNRAKRGRAGAPADPDTPPED